MDHPSYVATKNYGGPICRYFPSVSTEPLWTPSLLKHHRIKMLAVDMAARTDVALPDLFRCFLVQEPRVNRNYVNAKLASEIWLARYVDRLPAFAFGRCGDSNETS